MSITRSPARWTRIIASSIVFSAAALAAVSSCSSGNGAKCTPGASAQCACANGREGAQVCQQDGTFAACSCADLDAAPPADSPVFPDVSSSDVTSDVAPDTSALQDASQDTSVAQDASQDASKDASSDAATSDGGCSSGLACEQCNVSGYTPTVQSGPRVMIGACTTQQMSDFATACFGPNATQQTCSAWQTSVADAGNCGACVFTLQSAASWGPVVCTNASCTINSPGCIDLELNQVSQEKQAGGSGSCGDVVSDSYGCQDYACGTCAGTDFSTCTQSAIANECKSYVDAVNNATQCAVLNGDAAPPGLQACFPQSATDIPAFTNIFCGTGP